MKLTFEIQGYTITIDETEEGILVAASKDEETVEEFTLELGAEGDDDLEIDDDGDDDFEGDDDDLDAPEEGEEMPFAGEEEEDFGDEGEGKLESFSSFIKKRK